MKPDTCNFWDISFFCIKNLKLYNTWLGSRSRLFRNPMLEQHWRWEALLSGVIEAPHLPKVLQERLDRWIQVLKNEILTFFLSQLEGPQDLRYFTNWTVAVYQETINSLKQLIILTWLNFKINLRKTSKYRWTRERSDRHFHRTNNHIFIIFMQFHLREAFDWDH